MTLLGSTRYGSMAMQNFTIAGTVQFGMSGMDRGAMIMDVSDAQRALDMDDAAGEILGFLENGIYNDLEAQEAVKQFYATFGNSQGEFAPIMLSLKEQNDLASMFDYVSRMIGTIIFVFVFGIIIICSSFNFSMPTCIRINFSFTLCFIISIFLTGLI